MGNISAKEKILMQVNETIEKLKKLVKKQIDKKNYEVALAAAKTLADIYYSYNQIYTDKELEDELLVVRDAILEKKSYEVDKKCVFFYDGFGLDLRGWAASYARALTGLGYFVVYACPKTAKGKIPHIVAELGKGQSKIMYFDDRGGLITKAKLVDAIFKEYKPCTAFFYTTPFDVSAAVAFSNNTSTSRVQINLTDHAYWIGTNAFDYITSSREMGASIDIYERGVLLSQLLRSDCAPYIIKDKPKDPYPFDIYSETYIFTGGALYKTLGDKELLYYKTIDYILGKYKDMKFLYAGFGDDTEIKKLKKKFEGRVFHIPERPDFFEIIKQSILYINSYPMFGGLMMRYAALAHKVPITLKHEHDGDGILIDQEKLGIEYADFQEYLQEIDKLLTDGAYRKAKEELVSHAVVTEEIFAKNLDLIIKEHRTMRSYEKVDRLDTTKFRAEYRARYKYADLCKSFAKRDNKFLVSYFPKECLYGAFVKIKEKLTK